MHFVGLDLAWGEKNQTGVAAIDSDGRLLHVGAAQDDADIIDAIAPFTGGDCLVAFDAPLIVNNPTGHRPAETAFNRDFQKFDAGARPAFAEKPELKNPRAARLAAALDLDMDPASGVEQKGDRGLSAPGDRRAVRTRQDTEVQDGGRSATANATCSS